MGTNFEKYSTISKNITSLHSLRHTRYKTQDIQYIVFPMLLEFTLHLIFLLSHTLLHKVMYPKCETSSTYT